MAWIHTYDVNTPAGTDDPKEGDDRIREVKAALQERIAKDHYFPKTGSQVSDEDAGEHKKVTLRVGSAPTKADDKGFLYAKDIGDPAKAELFYRDEDGDEVQLTSEGGNYAIVLIDEIALKDATVMPAQSNCDASNYALLQNCFNALLAKLRAAGLMAS